MAVRRVPEDHPDVQSAVDASAPGDRIEVGAGVFNTSAHVLVDALTIDHSGGFFSSGAFTLGIGVRSLALPGSTLFRVTGDDGANLIAGGGGSGFLYGRGGDDELRGGGGNDTYLVSGRGDRVVEESPAFEKADEVLAAVDYVLPANVENLFLDGATAVWGSGNGGNNRVVGNENDNRLVGWGGVDTLTGGAGDDVFHLLETAPFRTTITDFWPGAGSDDRLAFSGGLYASREEVLAAARQTGADVSILREGAFRVVVLQNTRLADLAPDDIFIV